MTKENQIFIFLFHDFTSFSHFFDQTMLFVESEVRKSLIWEL